MSDTQRLLDLPLREFEKRAANGQPESYWVDDIATGSARQMPVLGGSPQVVADELFGSALVFDGQGTFIDLTVKEQRGLQRDGFSVSVWLRVDKVSKSKAARVPIAGGENAWTLQLDGGVPSFAMHAMDSSTNEHASAGVRGAKAIEAKQWVHLVGVFTPQSASIYVDGALEATEPFAADFPAAYWFRSRQHIDWSDYVPSDKVMLGRTFSDSDVTLSAQVARLRVFDGALTADDVRLAKASVVSPEVAQRETHALGFEFEDDGQRNVLYISDTGGHEPSVVIRNTAGVPLVWNRLLQETDFVPSRLQHHLELRFRPGIFPDSSLVKVVPPAGWNASGLVTVKESGQAIAAVYLAWVGPKKKASQTFGVGDTLSFGLRYDSVDAEQGSRSTNVVLGYRNMLIKAKNRDLAGVEGEKITSVKVVNHSGKSEVPLHVGFVQSNLVLNTAGRNSIDRKGDPATIKLRMINTLPKIDSEGKRNHVPFRTANNTEDASASSLTKFTLTWDTEHDWADDDNHWALTNLDTADGVTINEAYGVAGRASGTGTPIGRNALGQRRVFWFNPKVDSLGPGDYIDLEIHGLTALGLPSGPANITMWYEDLPGYWDGKFVLAVEKSPIVHHDHKVGIGTDHPLAMMHVDGATPVSDQTQSGYLVVGDRKGSLSFDDRRIQARAEINATSPASAPSALSINPLGGSVNFGAGGVTIAGGARVIGQVTTDTGLEVGIRPHRVVINAGGITAANPAGIHFRRNTLHLNRSGGTVTFGRAKKDWIESWVEIGGDAIGARGRNYHDDYEDDPPTQRMLRLNYPAGGVAIGGATIIEGTLGVSSGASFGGNGLFRGDLTVGQEIVVGGGKAKLEIDVNSVDASGPATTHYAKNTLRLNENGGPVSFGTTKKNWIESWVEVSGDTIQARGRNYHDNHEDDPATPVDLRLNPKGGKVYLPDMSNVIFGRASVFPFSDVSLKQDICDIDNALATVQQIKPRTFTWRESGSQDIGVVAQEIAEVLPQLVQGDDGKKFVSYNAFGVLAIAALQEQQTIIEDLQARLNELEA